METTKPALDQRVDRINQSLKDIIAMLIKDPYCLDDNPWRDQVYKLAIAHLETKRKLSGETNVSPSESGNVQKLKIFIEKFYKANDRQTMEEAAEKVTAYVYNATIESLKRLPSELKENAFTVAFIYLAKKFNP